MPEYIVPQFIEREPKIIGPFTFKQFIYVGMAGAICFIFYFSIPFHFFILATIFLMSGALALAFLKISGRSLPIILANFLKFSVSPRIYLWKIKGGSLKFLKKEVKKEVAKKELSLKFAEKSRLKELSTKVETKTK